MSIGLTMSAHCAPRKTSPPTLIECCRHEPLLSALGKTLPYCRHQRQSCARHRRDAAHLRTVTANRAVRVATNSIAAVQIAIAHRHR
jgi:hypothetical protein